IVYILVDMYEKITFESLSENKIKFGIYEKRVIMIVGFVFFIEGLEMAALSLMLPLLKIEFKISNTQSGILGSVLFVGLFLGSLITTVINIIKDNCF
ncbi:MAG: hypothetical protein ACK56I_15460, partial [bacterium]